MRIGSKGLQYQVPSPFMALVFEILGFSDVDFLWVWMLVYHGGRDGSCSMVM